MAVWRSVLVAALIWFSSSAVAAAAVVPVTGGAVEGAPGRFADVTAYKGIPYAAPPVGDLRWRPPQPVKAWEGVRKGDAYGNSCVQEPRTAATGPAVRTPPRPGARIAASEDCLYLNVWTAANAKPRDKRPVIVWIHGGGFSTGSGSGPTAAGDGLAHKGAVVVSMNYRLNIFGFFAHPELQGEGKGSAGNYGLMDTVAALKWVKANISKFGGDPNNVTIVGCSSGGGSVVLLMASREARGLFHRAIAQAAAYSGSPVDVEPVTKAAAFGADLGVLLKAPTIAKLREMPAAEISRLSSAPRGDAKFPFGPVIDGRFLRADTSTIFAERRQAKVPLIAGCTRDEGATLSVSIPYAEGFVDKRAPISSSLVTPPPGSTGGVVVTAWNKMMERTVHDLARRQRQTGQLAFVYKFVHAPPGTPFAYHCADYIYAMDNLDTAPEGNWTTTDRRLAEQLSRYWLNFARTGDPNGRGLPLWPVYEPGNPFVLVQGETVEAQHYTAIRAR